MKATHSTRQHWQLAPPKHESQGGYQTTLVTLTQALSPVLLQQAKAQAEKCLHAKSEDYAQLIHDFKSWLEQHSAQEKVAAYLTASLVQVLAEGDFATLMPRFLGLKYHCATLGRYWVDGVILLAYSNSEFKTNLITYIKEQIINIDHRLLTNHPEEAQLSQIWRQAYDRHNVAEPFSDWPWFSLLWQLEPSTFLNVITECRSHYTISSILILAGLSDDFALWQQAMCKAPPAFTDNGSWNDSFLLPMLLAEASQRLLQSVSDYQGHQQQTIDLSTEPEISGLIHDIATTVAQRADFSKLIMPWASQLFKTMSNHFQHDSVTGKLYQALLMALMAQLPNKQQLGEVVENDDFDTWLYASLLGWLAQQFPQDAIPLPKPESFIEQWQFNHLPECNWFSAKGETLINSSREFADQQPTCLLIEGLGLSLTRGQPEFAAKYWQKMWQGAYCLREAVKFNTPESQGYSPRSHDAVGLNYLLLSLGLAMLHQLESRFIRDGRQLESVINDLFNDLWRASFILMSIDSFRKNKIQNIQLNLLLSRGLWQQQAEHGHQHYKLLNRALELSHADLLKDLQSNRVNLITLLQFYNKNNLSDAWLNNELMTAGVNIRELLVTAQKLKAFNANKTTLGHQNEPVNITVLKRLVVQDKYES